SQEVGLFAWPEIPWKELAFPSVLWSLRDHRELAGRQDFAPRIRSTGVNPEESSGAMEALLRGELPEGL
ncbi:MAG: hypothetical protein GDA47_05025, partial [Rhodospirillales bacterium]|nr:hypothetical protein [Rhodospirillales bacterium]